MKYKLLHINMSSYGDERTATYYDIFIIGSGNMSCLSGIPQSIQDAFSYLDKNLIDICSEEDKLSFKNNISNLIAEANTIEELKEKVIEYII